MPDFRAHHEFQVVDVFKAVLVFGHGFPSPLGLVAVRNLIASAIGQDGACAIAIGINMLFFFAPHGIAVLTSIFFNGAFIPLQAELRCYFEVFVQLEFRIEDGHHGRGRVDVGRVGAFFENIEVRYVVALAMLHVDIIDVVPVLVERTQVGVGDARIIDGVGEAIAVGEVGALLAAVGKDRSPDFQFAIDAVIGFQRQVETVVLHPFHISLFHVVAQSTVVSRFFGTAGQGNVVFLVEHVAEQDIVPVRVDIPQGVDIGLRFRREGIPTACLVGISQSMACEDAGYVSLVFTIGVVRLQ